MYPIGFFSKIYRISSKTLRHYDAIGLLKPGYTDPQSGYRYYLSAQIPRINQIISLKQLGFSLTDIRTLIENPDKTTAFLANREVDTLGQIADLTWQLDQIRSFKLQLSEDNTMNYSAVVKSLPGGTVASMRFQAKNYDSFFSRIPEMGKEMKRQGAICKEPEYCFNIFHDGEYRDQDIDVETCEMVLSARTDSGLVQYKTINAIDQAVCVTHRGPYSSIVSAYAYAMKWIEQQGFEVTGMPRESYIDGIWNKPNDNDWLTEVQIPVK